MMVAIAITPFRELREYSPQSVPFLFMPTVAIAITPFRELRDFSITSFYVYVDVV